MGIQDDIRGISAKDGSTKARIERAALNLFAHHGIDGVSTKQIAKAANLSEGALYRHFSAKEDLARNLMQAIHNRLTDMIVSAQSHDGLKNQISFIVHHYCRIADDDWTLFQYHILYLQRFPGLSQTRKDTPLGAAADLLQASMDRKEIHPSNPQILAAMTLGIVVQTAQAKAFGLVDGPLSDQADIFIRAVLSVLNINDGE